ncbi:hypothetical protein [Aquimarina sp. AU58]|uniref:hypothetical protein n=1 Tax=Aquimarina sp. AU58 TaxID=1874112 RepID=UPI001F16FA4D|nr:hypothetical protein [Aquimarina sp. AU58]
MEKKYLLTGLLLLWITGNLFAQWNTSSGGTNIYRVPGNVGVGTSAPKAKLDVKINHNFLVENESGLRLTYPIPSLPPNGAFIINKSIFEIRQETSSSGNYSTKMVVKKNGNVGIGVSHDDPLLNKERVVITDNNPEKIDLHVKGFELIDGLRASLLLGATSGAPYGHFGMEYTKGGLNFWKPNQNGGHQTTHLLFISDNGNVSIGTDNSKGYKFAVKGNMIAEEIKVKLHGNWPDFVFNKKYDLMDLEQVETYINKNAHLPKVPSAREIEKDGINLGEMNALLLQKIEELTLYVIQQNKKTKLLEDKIATLMPNTIQQDQERKTPK